MRIAWMPISEKVRPRLLIEKVRQLGISNILLGKMPRAKNVSLEIQVCTWYVSSSNKCPVKRNDCSVTR